MKRNDKLVTNKYLEFFVPTVLTAMATNLCAIVDASLVGNLMDSAALSVINILLPIVQIYASLAVLFGVAGSVIIASSRGRDATDTSTGNKAYTVICVSIMALSAIFMILQFTFLDGIIAVLTPVEELRPLLKEYYIPLIAGTPVTLLMSSLVHIIRTDSRPQFATGIVITANVVNLVFDIVFIRFFGLGLTGASLATLTGSTVGLIMVISHFVSKRSTLKWDSNIVKRPQEFLHDFVDILANGVSSSVAMLLTTGKLLFLNLLIQHYGGKTGMVAFSAVSICQILEGAFVAGGCQSMVPIISLLYGEKDYTGIKMTFRRAVKILGVICISITLIMEIFPQLAAIIYGIRGDELPITVSAIRICALMLVGDALTCLLIYMYMCTENRTLSTVLSVLNGIALIIPTGLVLAKLWGINGVWMALPITQYAALAVAVAAAFSLKKKKNADNIYLLDRSCDTEIAAFSIGGDQILTAELINEITICSDENIAAAVGEIVSIIERAGTLPHKSKNTDVRICKDEGYSVSAKSSGAEISGNSFSELGIKYPMLTYSEAIGFNQINLKSVYHG